MVSTGFFIRRTVRESFPHEFLLTDKNWFETILSVESRIEQPESSEVLI